MTLEGMPKLMINISALEMRAGVSLEKAALAGAAIGERYTKEGAPVDTGALRASYSTEIEKKSKNEVITRTGSDIEYAPFQEFGTSRQSGKPHLRPGFLNHLPEIESVVKKTLKGIV